MRLSVTLGFEQWKTSVGDQTILLGPYSEVATEETLDSVAQALPQTSIADISITHQAKCTWVRTSRYDCFFYDRCSSFPYRFSS